MAGGTADDERDGHADANRPVGIAGAPVEPPRNPGTPPIEEWTASDRRGPLTSATVDDVERFVPGSEMDPDGTRDPAPVHPAPTDEPPVASTFVPHDTLSPADEIEAKEPPAEEAEHDPGLAVPPASEPPASEPAMAAAPVDPPPPRRSFAPLALGIVVGALIGAGSAAAVYALYGGDHSDAGTVAALSSRVDALDKRPDPQQTLAALKSQVDDLAGKVAALDKRSAAGAAAALKPSAPAQPASDPALGAKIAAVQASLEALQKQSLSSADSLKSQQQALDGKIGALQTAVGSAQKQASAAQSGIDAVQTEQKSLAGKLGAPALAVVADSLVGQVASGKPYATQVDALTSLGADPVKMVVLRQNAATGVSSAQALLAAFKPLVDPIIATGNKAPANANFGERLKHGLFGLVSVKRTDVTTGNDLSSRVALVQSDLAHDDVAGAYAVWSALPADAKQVSGTWGTTAKASAEALSAARALQADSINSLAARKS